MSGLFYVIMSELSDSNPKDSIMSLSERNILLKTTWITPIKSIHCPIISEVINSNLQNVLNSTDHWFYRKLKPVLKLCKQALLM